MSRLVIFMHQQHKVATQVVWRAFFIRKGKQANDEKEESDCQQNQSYKKQQPRKTILSYWFINTGDSQASHLPCVICS